MKLLKNQPLTTLDISSLQRFHPNLFIVGAGKCGTTSLFSYLSQHPQIFPSDEKEPHYYSLGLGEEDGPWVTGPHISSLRSWPVFFRHERRWMAVPHISSLRSYLKLFENAGDEPYRMEASASYLYYSRVPKLLKERVPDARIIILLRDPIEKAFSNFNHMWRVGEEKESFENAIKRELAGGRGYLSQGLYTQQVQRYFDVFGSSAVLILIYETFFDSLGESIANLCRWLNIDDAHHFDLAMAHNVGSERFPVSPALYAIASRACSWMSPVLVNYGKQLLTKTEKTELSNGARDFLKSYYREDSRQLADLIGMDISCWDIE